MRRALDKPHVVVVIDVEDLTGTTGRGPGAAQTGFGFRVERDPGGHWRTYRPDGTQILIGPTLSP